MIRPSWALVSTAGVSVVGTAGVVGAVVGTGVRTGVEVTSGAGLLGVLTTTCTGLGVAVAALGATTATCFTGDGSRSAGDTMLGCVSDAFAPCGPLCDALRDSATTPISNPQNAATLTPATARVVETYNSRFG